MWFGIALSAVLLAILLILSAPWWISLPLLFLPVYIGAIGYLQVRSKFCVSYGMRGQQHADDDDVAQSVSSDDAQKADKAKVRRMNTQAFAITLILLGLCGVLLAA